VNKLNNKIINILWSLLFLTTVSSAEGSIYITAGIHHGFSNYNANQKPVAQINKNKILGGFGVEYNIWSNWGVGFRSVLSSNVMRRERDAASIFSPLLFMVNYQLSDAPGINFTMGGGPILFTGGQFIEEQKSINFSTHGYAVAFYTGYDLGLWKNVAGIIELGLLYQNIGNNLMRDSGSTVSAIIQLALSYKFIN
jgi:hypothetical protein